MAFFPRNKLIKREVGELGIESISSKESFLSIQDYYKNNPSFEEIHVKKDKFIDENGREVTFRGINIAAKIPLTDTAHLESDKNRKISFVNTPFPIADAPIHLARLKYLGFNLLRWVVPWEAICPNEPGVYDLAYLEYLDEIVTLIKKYGFFVLIDFHQDVWSRFTGGSGAPLWTLEKLGLLIDHFEPTLASISHRKKTIYPLGHLFWATNADRYAAKTMYTLFFGGNVFAPDFTIDGIAVQDYLQNHYMDAITLCAKKLKRHSHIIGFDIMNEPHLGYISCKDLSKYHGLFRLGPSPLPLQGFALAEGVVQEIDIFEKRLLRIKSTHKIIYDPEGKSVWKDGVCLWKKYGVWGYDKHDKPTLLRKNYFATHRANEDFYLPFIKSVCEKLSHIDPGKICFIEHATGHPIPKLLHLPYKIGFSGHWYDAFVISMRKVWNFISVDMLTHKIKVSLPHYVQKHLSMQISRLVKLVQRASGKIPFLLSEFGIPFDLNRKRAYRSGNFKKQKEGLERSFRAVERAMVSCILWNYTSVNSNEKGDLWNNEDFSIFSLDQVKSDDDPYAGVRGKEAIVRPYPVKVPGSLISYSFNGEDGFFSCTFEHDIENKYPLEIFLPSIHFGKGFEVHTSFGAHEVNYKEQKLLFYPLSKEGTMHKVNIYKKETLKKKDKKKI